MEKKWTEKAIKASSDKEYLATKPDFDKYLAAANKAHDYLIAHFRNLVATRDD